MNLKKIDKYPSQLSEQNVVSIVGSVLLTGTCNCDGTLGHLQYMLVIIDLYLSLAVWTLLLIVRISSFPQAEKT